MTPYPPKKRTLKPSQIATLLQYLTGIPILGIVVACWPVKRQAQAEWWANWIIHSEVICDWSHWPIGSPRVLPPVARRYFTQQSFVVSYKKGIEWQRKQQQIAEAKQLRIMEQRRQAV